MMLKLVNQYDDYYRELLYKCEVLHHIFLYQLNNDLHKSFFFFFEKNKRQYIYIYLLKTKNKLKFNNLNVNLNKNLYLFTSYRFPFFLNYCNYFFLFSFLV